jgi:hypothetical protein
VVCGGFGLAFTPALDEEASPILLMSNLVGVVGTTWAMTDAKGSMAKMAHPRR